MTQQDMINKHLKSGAWLNPMMALKRYGISPSGYHHKITTFFARNPEYAKLVKIHGVYAQPGYYKSHRAKKIKH